MTTLQPTMLHRNLSMLSYAQGFTLWHYRANSGVPPLDRATLAATCAPDFWNPTGSMFHPGDIIHISASNGSAIAVVTRVDGREVETNLMMATQYDAGGVAPAAAHG